MSQDDWYRRTTWTETDQEEFFAKLKRTQKFSRIQYLKIQASVLINTRKSELIDVAEYLLNKILAEFPEGFDFREDAFGLLGDINVFRKDFDKAIEYYKINLSLDPNLRGVTYLSFCTLIVKLGKTEEYDYAESLLTSRVDYDPFPATQYVICSLLSIINRYNGKSAEADHFARRADEHAAKEKSGIPYRQGLGVVLQRDPELDRLVQEQ